MRRRLDVSISFDVSIRKQIGVNNVSKKSDVSINV